MPCVSTNRLRIEQSLRADAPRRVAELAPALIVDEKSKQRFGPGLVTDEVVIDEEHAANAQRAQSIELYGDLLRGLGAWPAAEHHDDVAKLATVRATPGELQVRTNVAFELQQLEAWRGRVTEIHHTHFPVGTLRRTTHVVTAKGGPDVLGLTSDHRVCQTLIALRAERGEAASGDDVCALSAVEAQKLDLAGVLHAHAAYPDDVGVPADGQRFDILIDDADLPIRGAQGGQGGKAQRRIYGSSVGQYLVDPPAKAPETFRKARIDEQQPYRPRPFSPVRALRRFVVVGRHGAAGSITPFCAPKS